MLNELLREKRRYGLPEEITDYERMLLEHGVPIQKIIGYVIFDDVRINVNRDVLIPRYETEEVMKKSLDFINSGSKVLDMCSGTGYIGLSIKKKTGADVTLSDISEEAIKQSAENAKINNLDVKIIKGDLFKNINDKFDLIISNPPYIPEHILLEDPVLDHEPKIALFGGKSGNDFYKRIIEDAPNYLNDKGTIVFEISEDNVNFLSSKGFVIENDINEKPRIAYKHY